MRGQAQNVEGKPLELSGGIGVVLEPDKLWEDEVPVSSATKTPQEGMTCNKHLAGCLQVLALKMIRENIFVNPTMYAPMMVDRKGVGRQLSFWEKSLWRAQKGKQVP